MPDPTSAPPPLNMEPVPSSRALPFIDIMWAEIRERAKAKRMDLSNGRLLAGFISGLDVAVFAIEHGMSLEEIKSAATRLDVLGEIQ